MKYILLDHAGYKPAMLGAMLSFGKTDFSDFETYTSFVGIRHEINERFDELSEKLVRGGAGHDKFLEQLQYWIAIQAPLYWWKQFDTYRIGVSKSSESTMHKSWKNGLTLEMFEQPVYQETLDRLNANIREYNSTLTDKKRKEALFGVIVGNLPDGYLQTRIVNINAKSLRNIYLQRKDHKLDEWRDFCEWLKTLPKGNLITMEK